MGLRPDITSGIPPSPQPVAKYVFLLVKRVTAGYVIRYFYRTEIAIITNNV
jgi:hypothetical protein